MVGHGLITRSRSAAALNFYINHRKIYPLLAQDGDPDYADASGIIALPDTYFFLFPGGGLIFWRGHGNNYKADIYSLLPRKRGALARQSAKEALTLVFSQQQPDSIQARAPDFNAQSRHFLCGLGFERTGVNPGAFVRDGVRHDVVLFEISRDKWESL